MNAHLDRGALDQPAADIASSIDCGLYGLDPVGDQVTNLLIIAITAAAVGLRAHRLLGRRDAWIVAAVSGVFQALQPQRSLGDPGRRTTGRAAVETLRHRRVARVRRRHRPFVPWLAAVCALFAFGSKESGLVSLPFLFVTD